MGRRLRYLWLEDPTVEVTVRTVRGMFLLRPSPELNRRIVGVIGRALERYPSVRFYGIAHLSNHLHLFLGPEDAQVLSKFMKYVNENISKEAGRLHDWSGKLFARRYKHIESLDRPSNIARLRYCLAHGVKEHLVSTCAEWPGINMLPCLLDGEPLRGVWYDRSAAYEARRRGKDLPLSAFATEYEIHVEPIPEWEHDTPEERRQKVLDMVREIEEDAAREREEKGRPEPPGADWVLSRDPHDRPKNFKKSPAPDCHASSPEVRETFREAYREFAESFSVAVRALRRRVQPSFPAGCFPPAPTYVAVATMPESLLAVGPVPAPT